MSYYFIFYLFIGLACASVFWALINQSEHRRKFIAITFVLSLAIVAVLKFMVKPELEKQARYVPQGEIEIVWNPADQDYYINHKGMPIKLREACPDEFGEFIDPSRLSGHMKVNVYEKSYLSKWGLKLSTTPEPHFAHGRDVRLEQGAEIK